MKEAKKIKALIKKLHKIYKKGYMPTREKDKYNAFHAITINCYGHACLNLSNSDLHKLEDYKDELASFILDFQGIGSLSNHINEAAKRLKKVGLKLEKSSLSEDIKKNQWKIAFYVRDGNGYIKSDYHYMIQLNDGKWASKMGFCENIDTFDKLPTTCYESCYGEYNLIGVYKITNPYVKLHNEEDMEM